MQCLRKGKNVLRTRTHPNVHPGAREAVDCTEKGVLHPCLVLILRCNSKKERSNILSQCKEHLALFRRIERDVQILDELLNLVDVK